MVFQSYALYPHMSVYKNMAFGLENMGLSRERDRSARAPRGRRCCGSPTISTRKPKALSGGQRQRVAIGRAIVRDPKIFLFDEPLSNLDAELRVAMRKELAALHAELGGTMIYVTHDQVEAMTLADRIVVLRAGRIEQVGTPLELYNHPANRFVAGFIGSPRMNLLPARVAGSGQVAIGSETRPIAVPSTGQAACRSRRHAGRAAGAHRDRGRGPGRSCHHPRPGRAARWRNLPVRIGSRPAAADRAPGWAGQVRTQPEARPAPQARVRFTFSTRTETRSAFADTAEETISMKALTEGRYRGRDGIWAVFDLGWETELRVGILEQDIGRVVMKRDGGYRLDRGWSIAPNGLEPPYEGRSRDSTGGLHLP